MGAYGSAFDDYQYIRLWESDERALVIYTQDYSQLSARRAPLLAPQR